LTTRAEILKEDVYTVEAD